MILSVVAAKLKRRAKDDFKGCHFEAALIVQAVSWYLRYPLSYRDIEELFLERGLERSVRRIPIAMGCSFRADQGRPALGPSTGAPVRQRGVI